MVGLAAFTVVSLKQLLPCLCLQVIVQFQPSSIPDEWGTTPDGQTRPRVVKRGIDDDHDEVPDGIFIFCSIVLLINYSQMFVWLRVVGHRTSSPS